MKQSLILWIAAAVIVFVAGYYKNTHSPEYPVTGTIGIEGYRVSYKFDRIHSRSEDYKFLIRSDIEGLKGKLYWKYKNDIRWNQDDLVYQGLDLYSIIPVQNPGTELLYYAVLNYKNSSYYLPSEQIKVPLEFRGEIPSSIKYMYLFFLYMGLIMSTRTGLEYFAKEHKMKKFSVITVLLFSAAFVFNPLKNSYELGVINKPFGSVTALFNEGIVILFILWIAAMVLIFTLRKRIPGIIAAVSAILIFLIFGV